MSQHPPTHHRPPPRQALAPPAHLQVCNDDEGLRGCWFRGVVRRVQRGYALVAYEDLFASEDGEERLQVPAPAAAHVHEEGLRWTNP